jgi:hypothetical protein
MYCPMPPGTHGQGVRVVWLGMKLCILAGGIHFQEVVVEKEELNLI